MPIFLDSKSPRLKRGIVVVIDGTGNSAAKGLRKSFTNAFRSGVGLAGCKQTSHPIVLYFPGPGTRRTPVKNLMQASGSEINDIVAEAYMALCMNVTPDNGDKIFIFGFSRGAVAAKALISVIDECGLILKSAIDKAGHALALVRNKDETRRIYFQEFSYKKRIEFVGLFDPVLGPDHVNLEWRIDEKLKDSVNHAVEILALDEHRLAYQPSIWREDFQNQYTNISDSGNSKMSEATAVNAEARLQQIWLPGGHSDIGNPAGEKLVANIAFLTMLERLKNATEISIDPIYVKDVYLSILNSKSAIELLCITHPFFTFHRQVPKTINSFIHPLFYTIKGHRIRVARGKIYFLAGLNKMYYENKGIEIAIMKIQFRCMFSIWMIWLALRMPQALLLRRFLTK